MKDIQIVITTKRQKIELIIYAFSFLIALGSNFFAILTYKTKWDELWTEILVVFAISIVLYAITLIPRLIYWGIKAALVRN
ncbi:MAG: hypothetical protein Q8862_12140 [Bacteroidota bacterium]|nr:hypothetical protein [Bacteroidota bacterium]